MSTRIASPERRWRAAGALAAGAVIGWVVSAGVRLGIWPATALGLPPDARLAVIGAGLAAGGWLGLLVLRTHLTISDDGVTDHRMFRLVRVRWQQADRFEVGRPGGLSGGYCVRVLGRDGTTTDLLSVRAYSLVPSPGHLRELDRICQTLEEIARARSGAGS